MKNTRVAAALAACGVIATSSALVAQTTSITASFSGELGDPVPVVEKIADESDGFVFSSPNFVSYRLEGNQSADYSLQLFDLFDSVTHDLGLAVRFLDQSGPTVQANMPLFVSESSQGGQDLNGDGDALDDVLYLLDTSTYASRSTNIAADAAEAFGPFLLLSVREVADGKDWDGDGSISGQSYLLYDPSVERVFAVISGAGGILRNGSILALSVSEATFAGVPIDLTSDGDTNDTVPLLVDTATGAIAIVPIPVSFGSMLLLDDSLVLAVKEGAWSMDLDGDEDLSSTIVVRYDLLNETILNTGVQVNSFGIPTVRAFESGLLFPWLEAGKVDLNGDGDKTDAVHTVYVEATGEVVPLGLASASTIFPTFSYEVGPGILAVDVDEASQAMDLNEDGDQTDSLWVLFDTVSLAQTVIPFAADLGFLPLIEGDTLLFALSESDENSVFGGDLNGDGLIEGGILHAYNLTNENLMDTGLRVDHFLNNEPLLINDQLLLVLDESYDGVDRTGNDQASDFALTLVSPVNYSVVNFELSVTGGVLPQTQLGIPVEGAGPVVISRNEGILGEDLNNDGDQNDEALYTLGHK